MGHKIISSRAQDHFTDGETKAHKKVKFGDMNLCIYGAPTKSFSTLAH